MSTECTGPGEAPGRQPVRCSVHGRSTRAPRSWSAWARWPRPRPTPGSTPRRGPSRWSSWRRRSCGGRGLRRRPRPAVRPRPGTRSSAARRQHPGGGLPRAGTRPTRPCWWPNASASPRGTSRPSSWSPPSAGNNPQALMHDACLAISRGERDVVLVTGAEAMYARALACRDPARPWLQWAEPARGRRRPPVTLRRREARRHRARDATRRAPPGARLPPVRERAPRRQRLDARTSTQRASAPCGPASARWRRAIRTRGSARPARPTRS